jgi:hypothetical protein
MGSPQVGDVTTQNTFQSVIAVRTSNPTRGVCEGSDDMIVVQNTTQPKRLRDTTEDLLYIVLRVGSNCDPWYSGCKWPTALLPRIDETNGVFGGRGIGGGNGGATLCTRNHT